MLARKVREVFEQTNEVTADGTATALADALVQEGLACWPYGAHPVELMQGVEAATAVAALSAGAKRLGRASASPAAVGSGRRWVFVAARHRPWMATVDTFGDRNGAGGTRPRSGEQP
jgi:hypothetical protein